MIVTSKFGKVDESNLNEIPAKWCLVAYLRIVYIPMKSLLN